MIQSVSLIFKGVKDRVVETTGLQVSAKACINRLRVMLGKPFVQLGELLRVEAVDRLFNVSYAVQVCRHDQYFN